MIPYHVSSFLGGQSDYEDKGPRGSFKYGYGLDVRKIRDSLSCQQALKDDLAPGTMTALAKFIVVADDGNTYFFCGDGKIYSRHPNGVYVLVYTDTNELGNIIGATQWYSSAGFTYLLWATPTRLNIKKLLGPAYATTEPWSDTNTADTGSWPKVNLTSATFHTMKTCNGDVYIANGNTLAFVGYDLSYTNNALQLIPGNTAQAIVERGIYGIIGTNRSSNIEEASLYAWDGVAQNYNNKQTYKIKQINAMIDTEFALMQVGTNGLIYLSDMNTPMPVLSMYGGGQTYPDAVDSDRGMALFGVFGNTAGLNGVWTYGRIDKNVAPALNCEYPLTCDEIGSVRKINNLIYVTYRTGTNYGVKVVDTANKANALYSSLDLIVPLGTRRYPIPLGRLLNWAYIDLQHAPLPSGCAIEVWYQIDKTGGFIQASIVNSGGTTHLTTTGIENSVWGVGEKGRVLEVQVLLFPSGNSTPEVYEVNAYFDVG